MEAKGYNGWSNYETWNLALWIGNEQGSDSYWREVAEEAYREAEVDGSRTRREVAAYEIAERLKAETEEGAPDIGNSFYSDILGAAMSEVNYYEIAENWLEDVASDIDKQEAEEAAALDETHD
jgi:hypothetical protein